ncbi:cupin domain-containing protein [Streptomyces fuscigenes]|uniref:cupin domain-containing protein n=1 Tax=Streptomyces fuscigenes TaxID=1528880 RepID=UPI001F20B4C6|nr:cupin domain-containing protein [Streptomyces fuscigenes]MCF3960861.1 cupin domain-containing protein [Streptomyces fuscigenes]
MTFFENNGVATTTEAGIVHVPAGEGPARWFGADLYTVKLRAEQTDGAIGFVEASVPPGGGSLAHTHDRQTETFYLVSGELTFLSGERTFVGRAGDLVFVPPRSRHSFHNHGLRTAQLLFFYTPAGGAEEVFVEHGDQAEPGEFQQPWGPERFTADVMAAFTRSGTTFLP